MPSSPNYKRDYAQERRTAIKRGETGVGSNSSDAKRHKARRKKEKELGKKLPASVHVDHKKPIKSGGSNHSSNLALRPASDNSSHGGKIGSRKGKANGARKANRSKGLPVKKPAS